MKVDIIASDDFPRDWGTLDIPARQSLALLLERVQANPYEPALQEACEVGPDERYACWFAKNYVLHWRISSHTQLRTILPSEEDTVTVEITGIAFIEA